MKNGFTLVELLAVLIVLGFIALIITPVVISMINDSKREIILRSADLYVKGAEFSIKNQNIMEPFNPDKCTVVDSKHIRCGGSFIDVNIENTNVSSGNLYIKNETIETANLCIDNKLVEYVDDKYEIYDVGSCDNYITVNPILNGMTPVIYEDGSWVITDTSHKWYDYKNQEWANAVILTNNAKTKKVGEKLNLDTDVKAMFVWIPRYEYKIDGNYGKGGTSAKNIGEIEINFISKTTTKASRGYKVHPAFTFGDDELIGIWVGKFETSHISTNISLSCINQNCVNADGLRILPNVKSLTDNNISSFFYASKSMSRVNNPFGINGSTTDTHMMKNSEWGAVAYLSQSKYGKYGNNIYKEENKEIYQNKSSSYITGMSNGTPSQSTITNPQYTYDARLYGVGASTTGTIYGIYDMSGGAYEYVMGVLSDTSIKPRSGYNESDNSGFNGSLSNGSKTDGVDFPNEKYYDLYQNSNVSSNETIGHSLGETSGWYLDNNIFVDTEYPWIKRGGSYEDSGAGVFSFDYASGHFSGSNSFRVVIAPNINNDSD